MSGNAQETSFRDWLEQLRSGDEDAAFVLWDRYFPEVLRLAQRRLAGQPLRRDGPEDVALSVVDSILKAIKLGRFPNLDNRDELWRLLCVITRRKVIDVIRYNLRRREVGESHLGGAREGSQAGGMAGVPDPRPPDPVDPTIEEVRRLLQLLNDRERRAVELRLAGYTVKEIAQECGRGVSTIELYLKSARDKWTTELRDS